MVLVFECPMQFDFRKQINTGPVWYSDGDYIFQDYVINLLIVIQLKPGFNFINQILAKEP